MPNREKVIKGLKLCATGSECTGRDCPYWHNVLDDAIKGCDCTTELVRDALALLKDQETTFEKDGHHIRCTSCGNYWCDTDREGNLFPHNYCPECGREVKWDE